MSRHDLDPPNKDFIYVQPRAFEFTYYLSDCVQDSHQYHELLQTLDNASENDAINIVINNDGGEVGTCIQLVDHIRNSRALVIGILSGNACSAAGVIFLACHQHVVADHSMLMIHGAVGMAAGKYTDMAKYLEVANRRTRLLYEDIFEGFLTDEELESVFKGEELWYLSGEVIERLRVREKHLLAKDSKQVDEERDDLLELINETPPEEILSKLTKAQLIQYINGSIDVKIEDDGKFSIVAIDME